MKRMKTTVAVLLAFVMIFSLAACGSGSSGSGGGGGSSASSGGSGSSGSGSGSSSSAGSSAGSSSGSSATAGLNIGIVTTSGVDDGNFGQDCYNGILAFINDHPDAKVTAIKEPDNSKVNDAVAAVIADYDVLVLPGFQFSPAGAIGLSNPDKKIILVDVYPQDENGEEVELDNIYAMLFKEEESGFFAGIAAAMESKTGKVAVVNGIAFPSNVNYQYGFMAGVNYANKYYGTNTQYVELPSYAGTDVTGANVGGNYIGDFADEATGKIVGNALIDQGVDVLFVAAGASGNGVFAAAKEANNVWLIGCDVDQYDDGAKGNSNIILTSALKVMNLNVTRQLKAISDGSFKGQNAILGADTDSTGYVSASGRQQLGADTLKKMEEAYGALKEGKIVPPANFNGLSPTSFTGL
ncbi:MAG: BMP family ABC transporter substrate-binding protein [Clostridiales bacterium]|nr:BMP family ABC transporter substrate-binding protein [Clostridiales bacterium]